MTIYSFFTRTLKNYKLILFKKRKNKSIFFFNYSKIIFKNTLHRVFNINFRHESFLDFQIFFPDYSLFTNLYENIFLNEEYFFESKSKKPKIIDGGGNIGMTLLYFKFLFPHTEIIAFEPDEETYDFLKINVEKNSLSNCILRKNALYDKKTILDFYSEGKGGLGSSIVKRENKTNKKTNKNLVKTDILSKYVDKKIDLLKLDVEGAETRVISELDKKSKLSKFKQIFLEYHHNPKDKKNSLKRIKKILFKNNFKIKIPKEKINLEKPFNLIIKAKR